MRTPTGLYADERFLYHPALLTCPPCGDLQESRATSDDIQAELASQVRISASHVRSLSQQVYLPLLACHERQHQDRLAQVAQQQGGLIIALDSLAPTGGEPHMWFMRELSSGLP